ncbi:hypothetical protein IQ07DRAFT_685697 [Pyrenochaeta sp. DS3sAY3a]|nr:hypothetical protein IQ07DRAFT_685697 [Pyrenochaeta sp. DS3sAY3a]
MAAIVPHVGAAPFMEATSEPVPVAQLGRRAKRGKYVSRACHYCQRRKIKCAGGLPCTACALRRRPCIKTTEATESVSADAAHNQPREHDSQLLDRLAQVERQLEALRTQAGFIGDNGSDSEGSHADEAHGRGSQSESSMPCDLSGAHAVPVSPLSLHKERSPTVRGAAFLGETSLAHALDRIEGELNASGAPSAPCAAAKDARHQVPMLQDGLQGTSNHLKSNFIQRALLAHQVTLDRKCWDHVLDTFIDEVHILYPALHLPSLSSFYVQLWETRFLLPVEHDSQPSYDARIKVAQIFLCLAIGTCVTSTRMNTDKGKHASGWSLYSVAMDIIGNALEMRERASPLLALQTLLLILIYLFRLDTPERGEPYMALAVCTCHQLGIHRARVLDRMLAFEDEMYRRVWWSIYVLDRRYALWTGRPFLTQDYNIDASMPRNIDDVWLSTYMTDSRRSSQLDEEIRAHLLEQHWTPIPYLCIMSKYSRILSKVWEIIYGVDSHRSPCSRFTYEYLEALISDFECSLPQEYRLSTQDSCKSLIKDGEWKRLKHGMLITMRITNLRLLIRTPTLQMGSSPVQEHIANEVRCIQLSHAIIDMFTWIPADYRQFMFPFIHYLANATILSLTLQINRPQWKETYGPSTIKAAQRLSKYCTKTWVSGNTIRSVRRLNQMVTAVFGQDEEMSLDPTGDTLAGLVQEIHPTLSREGFIPEILDHTNSVSLQPPVHASGNRSPLDWQLNSTSNMIGMPSDSTMEAGQIGQGQGLGLTETSPGLADMTMIDFEFEEMLQRTANNSATLGGDMAVDLGDEVELGLLPGSFGAGMEAFSAHCFKAMFGAF